MKNNIKNTKRERIIESALLLFAKYGYHGVCMDAVARDAKVAKGTLYNYFLSKEDLYDSIIPFRLDNLLKSIQRAFNKRKNVKQNLKSYIVHIYSFMLRNPCFFKIWKEGENRHSFNIKNKTNLPRQKMRNILLSVLKGGEKERIIKNNIDFELYTDLILGTIEASVERKIKNSEKNEIIPDKKEKENLIKFIFNAINFNNNYF